MVLIVPGSADPRGASKMVYRLKHSHGIRFGSKVLSVLFGSTSPGRSIIASFLYLVKSACVKHGHNNSVGDDEDEAPRSHTFF